MGVEIVATGANAAAPFTLKVHRGEGMALLGMNWREGTPPENFVGFEIAYEVPGGAQFHQLANRLGFANADGTVTAATPPSSLAPFQKWRWVHFPFDADATGEFVYRVTPVFMDEHDALSYGETQEAAITLGAETYPGQLNVAFTRGFVSSQAFVDRFQPDGKISTMLPANANAGLNFKPTHPDETAALTWMGFEARAAILSVLDQAVADETTKVLAIAYDLNEPEVVDRLRALGNRLTMIIDNSGSHGAAHSAEDQAAQELTISAGAAQIKRQHMGELQHNKIIVVTGPNMHTAVCGSTNFSWRAFYVQNNNAMVVTGESAVQPYVDAFNLYWATDDDKVAPFAASAASEWNDLGLTDIDAKISFSPHSNQDALLTTIADDIKTATSSLFYSLAFLSQTPGPIRSAIEQVTEDDLIFVYGISDLPVVGLEVQTPSGNLPPVSPGQLAKNLPQPFKAEPTGGAGVRMHHKFVVIDFDKPTARVYVGSYNFSSAADLKNGENLLLLQDPRIAVSYMIEAVRIFDHYEFRARQEEAATALKQLALQTPPRKVGDLPWWSEDYTQPQKIRDRLLFS
jgi:hypothetical protein